MFKPTARVATIRDAMLDLRVCRLLGHLACNDQHENRHGENTSASRALPLMLQSVAAMCRRGASGIVGSYRSATCRSGSGSSQSGPTRGIREIQRRRDGRALCHRNKTSVVRVSLPFQEVFAKRKADDRFIFRMLARDIALALDVTRLRGVPVSSCSAFSSSGQFDIRTLTQGATLNATSALRMTC